MKKTTLLVTLTCIFTFSAMNIYAEQAHEKDLDNTKRLAIEHKVDFLEDKDVETLNDAIQQIKWRIRSGYLAELNIDLNAIRWLVKHLAERFNVKTTIIAAKLDTVAARQYIHIAKHYLELLNTASADYANQYQHLYPEYEADLIRDGYVYI